MKFHMDEHIAGAISLGLRRQGVDVTTTVEARLLGVPYNIGQLVLRLMALANQIGTDSMIGRIEFL